MLKKFLTPRNLKWTFIIFVCLFWIGIYVAAYDGTFFDWKFVVKQTGSLAWGLMVFTIFISLAQKITVIHFPKFWIFTRFLPLRKWTGVFAFLIVCSHAVAEFVRQGALGDVSQMLEIAFSTEHAAVFGSIAFLIMLPIFLTSTNWAVKKMGFKSWKALQRFTHVAFVLAALHVALIEYFGRGEIEGESLVWLGIYVLGYGYLWALKLRKK